MARSCNMMFSYHVQLVVAREFSVIVNHHLPRSTSIANL